MNMSFFPVIAKLLIISGALFLASGHSDARTWTNTQGKTIEAEWIRTEGNKVVVKLPNGKSSRIPLQSLSREDQDFAAAMMKSGKDGQRTEKKKMETVQGPNPVSPESFINAVKKSDLKTIKLYIKHGGDIHTQSEGLTCIWWAIETGQLAVVKTLINAGADIDFLNERGAAPVMSALDRKNVSIAKLLLDHGARLDVVSNDGMTPLLDAIKMGNPQILKLVISSGADVVSEVEKIRQTPMRFAQTYNASPEIRKILERAVKIQKDKILAEGGVVEKEDDRMLSPGELMTALERGNKELVKQYIAKKGKLDVKVGENGWYSPLYLAVQHGQMEMAVILLDGGANIEFPAHWGSTPLMSAARSGNVEMAKLLISRKANINAVNHGGSSVLTEAIMSKNPQMIRLILDSGADVLSKNEQFKSSPLQFARELELPPNMIKLLESAIATQKYLIKSHGGVVPEDDGIPSVGEVSLAIKKGNKAIVQKYIDHECPLDVCNRDGIPLICVAAEQQNPFMLKLLLNAGADMELANGDERTTPVSFAARAGCLNNVILLDDAGANLNSVNRYGMTPILFAVEEGWLDVVKYLLTREVNIDKMPTGKKARDIVHMAQEWNASPKLVKLLSNALEKKK